MNYLLVPSLSALIALPTGYIYGVPVKHAIFAFIVFLFALRLWRHGVALNGMSVAKWLAVVAFLIFYAIMGAMEWGSLALRELQMMVLPLAIATIIVLWGKESLRIVYLVFCLSMFIITAIKVWLLAVGSQGIDVWAQYREIFGASFVSMQIAGTLFRIYLPTDILSALAPAILTWYHTRRESVGGTAMTTFVMLCATFVCAMSYSRFLWLLFLMSAIPYVVIKFGRKLVWVVLASVVLGLAMLQLDVVKERFSSENTASSDELRVAQVDALLTLWYHAPMLGNGLGAYNTSMIRSEDEPYSYELQVLSLLPKLGIVGFLVIAVPVGLFGIGLLRQRSYLLALLFALVIGAGAFNPYLFNSSMSLVYAFLYLAARQEKERLSSDNGRRGSGVFIGGHTRYA